MSLIEQYQQQHHQQLEMLTIEHSHTMDILNDLILTLEQQYELAVDLLTKDESYGPKYAINLGLVHSVLTSVQAATKFIQMLKNDVTQQGKKERISVYLMREEFQNTLKKEQQQQQWNPNNFIQKHRYSTQIQLHKGLLSNNFLQRVQKNCKNIFTIKLFSDQFEQKNQIEDMDINKLTIFHNISVLELKDSAITDNAIQIIRDNLVSIKQLDLSGCYMLTERSIKLLTQCNLVTVVMNSMSSLKQNSIIQLIKGSHNLNYLEIKDCQHITEQVFMSIYDVYKNNSSTLKWLQIISDYGIDLFINKLTYLTSSNPLQQITDSQLRTLIGENPPKYTGIYFQNCQQLTKLSVQLIVQKCRSVKRLALSKYINLTDRLVQDLTLSLSSINFLDLNNCNNITDNALYYVANNLQIQYLILQKCLSITDQGLGNILSKFKQVSTAPKRASRSVSKQKKQKQASRLIISRQKSARKQLQLEQAEESSIKLRYLNIAHCKKITDHALSQLGYKANLLFYLNLSYCDQITDASIEVLSQFLVNLQYLNLNHCEGLTDSSISMLATRLSKKLKVLEIEWCQISQNCIRLIVQNLTNLRVLNISYCPWVHSEQIQLLSKNMPKLHTLKLQSCSKINEYAFIKLASLRELKIITIKQCIEVSDTFVKLLTTNNKYMEHLDLSWCSRVTDMSLFYVAKNCFSLKYLNLNGCVEITDEGVQWLSATVSKIQYLNLTLCSKLTDTSILQITSNLKSLKQLYLCELQNLTDISIASTSNLDRIEQLILLGCTGITSSSLVGLMYNLQKLTQLNISQCRSVHGKCLNQICQFMKNMKILQISEIQVDDQFLYQLATYCPKLTYLNLCYCNEITDEAVLKLLERLPRLERIGIQSTNIHERTKEVIFHALNSRRMANIVLQ